MFVVILCRSRWPRWSATTTEAPGRCKTIRLPPPAPVAHLELKAALLLALFVLLVAGTVLYLMYARGAFESTQRLVLVADDSEGVSVGMDITFSGFPIGRVRRIELADDGNARILIDVPRQKRTEELARIKAEKAAAPKEDQEGGKVKKSKETPAEGKEKAAASKKDQEGGKVKKSKEAPAEDKEKAAAPPKEQEAVKEEKKSKETPAEGKEKAAAPKKDQEDGKVKKSKEAPAEGKEKKKKKEDHHPETSE